AVEGAAHVARERPLEAEVEEADGEGDVGAELQRMVLARGEAERDLGQADELLQAEGAADLFGEPGVLEVGQGVEVPARGLEWEVELEQAHAEALVEDGERIAALGIEEVGGVPEAAGAP